MGAMQYVYNDGGREAAGYRGYVDDCVTRSIAIAAEIPYKKVYRSINRLAKAETMGKRKFTVSHAKFGVYRITYQKYLNSLGWEWTPTMGIGTGCFVHLHPDELPSGRLIVVIRGHLVAVINGVIHDTSDCSGSGKVCVYGYWTPPPVSLS